MEGKRLKILDGILDVSLRVMFILSKYNDAMDKERIIVYDYISSNIDNRTNDNSIAYVGLQKTINKVLHLLLSKQLIECYVDLHENYYILSSVGRALVEELSKEKYADILSKRIQQADKILHDVDKKQLSLYLKTQI